MYSRIWRFSSFMALVIRTRVESGKISKKIELKGN